MADADKKAMATIAKARPIDVEYPVSNATVDAAGPFAPDAREFLNALSRYTPALCGPSDDMTASQEWPVLTLPQNGTPPRPARGVVQSAPQSQPMTETNGHMDIAWRIGPERLTMRRGGRDDLQSTCHPT